MSESDRWAGDRDERGRVKAMVEHLESIPPGSVLRHAVALPGPNGSEKRRLARAQLAEFAALYDLRPCTETGELLPDLPAAEDLKTETFDSGNVHGYAATFLRAQDVPTLARWREALDGIYQDWLMEYGGGGGVPEIVGILAYLGGASVAAAVEQEGAARERQEAAERTAREEAAVRREMFKIMDEREATQTQEELRRIWNGGH